jgi:hypothetical protein
MDSQQKRSKSIKWILLCIALFLPISIFVFLKMFGMNEFQVPILFQSEVPSCNDSTTFPYHVPNHVVDQYGGVTSDSLLLLFFGEKGEQSSRQIKRVSSALGALPVKIVVEVDFDGVQKRCAFLMPPAKDVVLVDGERNIRGQYASSDREDMDRLLTEISIILKRY